MKQNLVRLRTYLCDSRAQIRRADKRSLTVLSWVFFVLLAASQILAIPTGGRGILSRLLLGVQLLFSVALTLAGGTSRFPIWRIFGGWLAFACVLVPLPETGVTGEVLFALFSVILATTLTLSWLELCLLFLPPFAAFLLVAVRAHGAREALAVFLPAAVLALCGAGLSLSARLRQAKALTELRQRAERDPLTGTLNRRAMEDRFSDVAARGNFALAVADLDHFKAINDHAGHAAGDAALVNFCRFTERFFGERGFSFVLSRFGGDEFVLLFSDVTAKEELFCAIEDYCKTMCNPGAAASSPCSCSMGAVFSAAPAAEFSAVFDAADRELYRAKQQNGACASVTCIWQEEKETQKKQEETF